MNRDQRRRAQHQQPTQPALTLKLSDVESNMVDVPFPPLAAPCDYSRCVDLVAERAALLTLLRDRKNGWGEIADQVEACGSAVKVLEARCSGDGRQQELFAPDASSRLEDKIESALAAIKEWEGEGIKLVTLLDPDYPAQLLTIHQRPPFLLYRGELDPGDAHGVAVVGTRHPSDRARARAVEIGAGLAERGVTVISGLAQGVDTAAHFAALSQGGRTVAVVGTGLRRVYPAANRELQERIARDHLVLSQFWPSAPPTRHSFPMRNAVMSGYAAATVVIEAAWKSGARMQARLALEHGRPVFLHDSLLEHDWAVEYHRRGAVIVSSASDVLAALEERLAPPDELVWA